MDRDLEIVIPAAGLGRRMKSYGTKALLQLTKETVIGRQIRLLQDRFPDACITVVVGFEGNRVRKILPPDVSVVENPNFEETNVSRSIAIGLNAAEANNVLVIYGDLVFTPDIFDGVDLTKSCVFVSPDPLRTDEVGVTVVNDKVTHFSYGLPLKWSHIAVLGEREQRLFRQLSKDEHRAKHFGYEILNGIIERHGSFDAVPQPSGKLVEIDSSKHLAAAREISETS